MLYLGISVFLPNELIEPNQVALMELISFSLSIIVGFHQVALQINLVSVGSMG